MMSDDDIAHVQRLLQETRRRHDALEIQAARYGPNRAPAEITIELQEARESIARLNAKLRIVTVPTAIQEATGPEASIDVLRLNVKELKDQLGTMWRYLESMILEDRAQTYAWRDKQEAERTKGVRERRVIEGVLIVSIIVLYIVFARAGLL